MDHSSSLENEPIEDIEHKVEIFGDFDETLNSEEYLLIKFSPSSVPLKQRWRSNGLSADFLAEYLAVFFPNNHEAETIAEKTIEIKSAVSYVANELLENAVKFNDDTSQQPISIKLEMHTNRLVFLVKNSLPTQSVSQFQSHLRILTTSDCGELYIHQLESNMQSENVGSGLGLLTIMNDYMAKIGWKFEYLSQRPEVTTVTTMVQLDI